MYFDHSSRPRDRHKDLDPTATEFFPAPVTRARRGIPLTPAERARRIHELRTALAGTAPLFQARVRRGAGGDRT